MSRARTKVAGCVLVLAVLGAACSDDGDSGGKATPTTIAYDATEKVASPAVELRAHLTSLLQEHVLLAGMASSSIVAGQDPKPATTALDENTAALAAEITVLYGAPTGQQFLDTWRRNGAALLEFASASAAADPARIDTAKAGITAVQGEVATLLNSVNNQLTTDAMGEALEGYSAMFQTAVTAMVEQDATALTKLKDATDEAGNTAIVMVAAIIKDKGKKDIPGAVDGPSAAVRTELSSMLQEHTYLAGLAAALKLAGGDGEAALEPLAENSLELSRTFATVYGDDAGKDFLELWRTHIGFINDFAEAAAAGDAVGKGTARESLDGYRTAFGAFLNSVNPNLSKEDVVTDLGEHVDSLLAAIESQAAKDPAQVVMLRAAAGHMPDTALYLATGIARQFPTKFG